MLQDGIKSDVARIKANRIYNEFSNIDLQKHIIENQQMMTVCSFCESKKDILMWSHYADEHKGFCMEYSLTKNEINQEFLQMLHPVIYRHSVFESTKNIRSLKMNYDWNILLNLIILKRCH